VADLDSQVLERVAPQVNREDPHVRLYKGNARFLQNPANPRVMLVGARRNVESALRHEERKVELAKIRNRHSFLPLAALGRASSLRHVLLLNHRQAPPAV
jgi:hypothetical protein